MQKLTGLWVWPHLARPSRAACGQRHRGVLTPNCGCVQPPPYGPVSGSGPQPLKGREARQSEERDTVFTCPFIKQELLHDNLIQHLLAISVEKIISLYIQKYRFEHYENNQDKYREKLVLQKK